MNIIKLILFYFFVAQIKSKRRCTLTQKSLKYHKIRNCYKSTLPLIAWSNIATLDQCMKYAREKRGVAFNFSPFEASGFRKGYTRSCQVMGCTEVGNTTTFVKDLAFDYYSAYGNWNTTINATCIKSVGIFALTEDKQNYTESIGECQNIGGDLADVTTAIRTNHLSQHINDTIEEWYKAAYVGLDDIKEEGTFMTASGLMLSCSTYRAWGPGHPISKRKDDDCVILDSDRMWRVVRCGIKLRALCEFYPGIPLEDPDVKNITCDHLTNQSDKKICNSKKKFYELYNNSTRIDKCAMLDDFEDGQE